MGLGSVAERKLFPHAGFAGAGAVASVPFDKSVGGAEPVAYCSLAS